MNIVHNDDCMNIMSKMKDNEVDLAIVDPPFSQTWGNIHDLSSGRKDYLKKLNSKYSQLDIKPKKEYFSELKRVSKKYLIFGYNNFTEFLGNTNSLIIWDKKITGLEYFLRFEIIYCSFQQSKIIEIESKKEDKIHSCQKPIALYKWLLKNYAKPGDKVFDSHVGSGSSRIACYELGFDFVGCELDVDYWNDQEKRFKLEKARIDGEFYLPENNNGLFNNIKE